MTDKAAAAKCVGGKKGKRRKKGKKVDLPPLKVDPPEEDVVELVSPATVELASPEKVNITSPDSPELVLPETDESVRRREEEQSALWDQIDDEHMDLPEGTSPSCESEPLLDDPTRRRSRSLSHSTFRTDSSSDDSIFKKTSFGKEMNGLILWPNNRMASPLTSPLSQSASANNLYFSSTAKIVRPDFNESHFIQKKRANSTSELLPDHVMRRRKTFFETDYSTEARSLLKKRNNSHFLPSYKSEPLPRKSKKRTRVKHAVTSALHFLVSAIVVYTSFSNIALITQFNPILKVIHYSGRMLFPLLDAVVSLEAADGSLWLAGQLGYFRALGRFSGTYRKLFLSTSSPPPSAGTLELALYYLHWLLDFLYFPTEHLGLVEWEAFDIFGIKSKLFFVQANAVVWYWRQIIMLALCIHACYTERLALSAGASLLYFAAVIADLMTAYAFLPFAPAPKSSKAPTTLQGKAITWFTTRNFTVGLGTCGSFGVCEGLIQMTLRYYYT